MANSPQLKARIKAMDYLARRDHSEKELREKLGRHFEPDIVEETIATCYNENWLSPPEELAERVALSLHRRDKSHYYISAYLHQKGLPEVPRDEELEREKARRILEKKSRKARDYQTLYTLLKNRGFDKETMKKVIHEVLGIT